MDQKLEKYIRDLIEPLVDNKESLMIRKMPGAENEDGVILVVGENNDIARLIGRGGSVADAIRKVVSIHGKINSQRFKIKFESFEATKLEE
jgi:uncharacterized protein